LRLIDANVFIYAAGQEHPYKRPCLQVLDRVQKGALEANTDTEVLQEILHFYQRRRTVGLGIAVLRNALTLFPDPLQINPPMLVMAGDIMATRPSLEARDAVHAAVILHERLEGIISTDRGFDAVPEIRRFDPGEL
jgi:predicted nucleic acid-binding protein